MKKFCLMGLVLILVLALSGCAKEEEVEIAIGTFWNAPYAEGQNGNTLDFSRASQIVQSQRKGFTAGLSAAAGDMKVSEYVISEKMSMQNILEDFAATENRSAMLMLVGASSQTTTMYLSAKTNYFLLPMLIPFTDGSLASEFTQNLTYTMALTPNGSDYADFISEKLLPDDLEHRINAYLFENKPVLDYTVSVGIFFQNNFVGHDIAQEVTAGLMENGMDIHFYVPYKSGKLLDSFQTLWGKDQENISSTDLILVIPESEADFVQMTEMMDSWQDDSNQPIFLYLASFVDKVDPSALDRENLFFVRQQMNTQEDCPAGIRDDEEASGYAAGYITGTALARAKEKQGPLKRPFLNFLRSDYNVRTEKTQYIQSYRREVNQCLKDMQGEQIPCLGTLKLDDNGDAVVSLELARLISEDRLTDVDPSEVFYRLLTRIQNYYHVTE